MKNYSGFFTAVFFIFLVVASCKNQTAKPDPCKDVVCQHGGNCVDGGCNCPPSWLGAKCETYYTTLFQGKYTGTGFNCGVFPAPFNDLNIVADTINLGKIFLRDNIYAKMDAEGSYNFTIPPQTLTAFSISGSGYFVDSDNVFIQLNITAPVVGEVAKCSGSFKKNN